MANHLLAMPQPPQVLSTSYGFDEPDLDHTAASNLCNAYMQLGARGTSVVRPQISLFGSECLFSVSSSLHPVMEVSPGFNLNRALPLCESIFYSEHVVKA